MDRFFHLVLDGAGRAGAEAARQRLQAVLDALPCGVLLAEAPGGRIITGNKALEAMLGHPLLLSNSAAEYGAWRAVHETGAPVAAQDWPLARALLGEDDPTLECQYLRPDGSRLWIKVVGRRLCNDGGDTIGALVAVTDVDEIKAAQARERNAHLELHHRVNNALAMVQAIANLSARDALGEPRLKADFFSRIGAVSRIQILLTQNSWEYVCAHELVREALGAGPIDSRIAFDGDAARLRSSVALGLGVAVHELKLMSHATGALSAREGRVELVWRNFGNRLEMEWRESGAPRRSNAAPSARSCCNAFSPARWAARSRSITPHAEFLRGSSRSSDQRRRPPRDFASSARRPRNIRGADALTVCDHPEEPL